MDLDAVRHGGPSANHGGLHGHSFFVLHRCQTDDVTGRNRRRLDSIQGGPDQQAAAQPADRILSAAGEVQRRADLVAAARRRRARRPDLGRRLRPDGRHRRVRPDARREVRNLLRAAYPRRDARRAAHDGLGAAPGAQQGQQAERRRSRRSKPGSAARRPRIELAEHMEISRRRARKDDHSTPTPST